MFDKSKYSVNQKLIKDFVKQLSKSCDYSYFLENMKNEQFSTEYWATMGEAGYIGIITPEECGGAGFRGEELAVFMYHMARSTLASYQLMTQIVCCELLTKFGTEKQKKKFLPEIIDGKLCSLATSDLHEGMNLFEMNVTAAKEGKTYTLNGTKSYVFGAKESDRLIVAARTANKDCEKEGISLFILIGEADGIELTPKEINIRTTVTLEPEFMTITGDRVYELRFTNVEIPLESRIGEENMGGQVVQEAADLLMIMMATAAVGWGDYVLEKAVEHAKKRVIFEEPIGSYQAVQHPLARAKTELELAKLAVGRAVMAYQSEEDKEDISIYAGIAKYSATEASYTAFDVSMQTHGGYSADRETGIITLWPMVLLSRIIPLNNDVILEKYAEAGLGLAEGAIS